MADKRKSNDKIIESQFKKVNTELKSGVFTFSGPMTINAFSEKINKPASDVVSYFFMTGKAFNVNYVLDEEKIAELCLEFGYEFQKETEVNAQNFMEHIQINEKDSDLTKRPPIITVMGHVDHGKTTLIDKIRKSEITKGEAGGITQHTGAYQVEYKKHKITFLDTPGHEAFSQMRSRGASLTDMVILVVAADDGVKPQTKEAIDHVKAAKVPIIVFINKMDKHGANEEKVINELSTEGIVSEDWGGDIQFVKGSALEGQGIDELFDAINIQAEMLELKANVNRLPMGVVVESRVDVGKGVIATMIVENGTLYSRDFIVAGSNYGRIRTMLDSNFRPIQKALPGTPIIITGLNYTPNAGDKFFAFKDEKFAKNLANEKSGLDKADELKERATFTVEEGVKVYNVVIKSDVQGTAEAAKSSLLKIENEEFKVNVVRSSVGMITKSDLLLAQSANATIFGFNIRPTSEIKSLAKDQKVDIKTFKIIYEMIQEVQDTINGMTKPKYEEVITGESTIQKVIYFSKVGNIAGCLQNEGVIYAGSKVRLIREGRVIYEGVIDSLQKGKDSVKKVEVGKDFGTHIKNYNDVKVGDIIESYQDQEVK